VQRLSVMCIERCVLRWIILEGEGRSERHNAEVGHRPDLELSTPGH